MGKKMIKSKSAAVTHLFLTACALALSSTASLPTAERQVLHGHMPTVVAGLQAMGHLPATNLMRLAIGLPLRNQQGLKKLLEEMYDPASTNFHRYLTPLQFTERFGPTEKDYQGVSSFMQSNGLTVTGTHPNRTLLDVRAAVNEVERVFHLRLQRFQHPAENRTFYAPDVEPSVELAIPLLSISGLDNYVLPHRTRHRNSSRATRVGPDADSAGGSWDSGAGYMGKDFRNAYAPDARTPWGINLTGYGQVLGLLQFAGYDPNDIQAYETLAGITTSRASIDPSLPAFVPLANVIPDGIAGGGNSDEEVCMDIEVAIAMAPGLSEVIVYEQADPSRSPYYPINDLLNHIANDNLAKQISSSWFFSVNANTEPIFQQFALQGQSFFQASGDAGAYANGITMISHGGSPADDPYVTSVGGTALTTGTAGGWSSETTWDDVRGGGVSGGGVSTVYAIPPWQQGLSMAANGGSTTMRNIPDVSMVAAEIVVVYQGTTNLYGGTSAAAPLWAGFAALANQQAAMLGSPPIGFVNPAIYAIGTGPNYNLCFHDINSGDNDGGQGAVFYAVPGYDLCTGWGSPAGVNLINALAPIPSGLVWVAFGGRAAGNGTYAQPYNTLARGVGGVSAGGTIVIKGSGSSAETMRIAQPMMIRAGGGPATIGH